MSDKQEDIEERVHALESRVATLEKDKSAMDDNEVVQRMRDQAIRDEDKTNRLRQKLADVKEGRRRAAQMIIEEIGAPGPESIEETATRAVDAIRSLKRQRNEARAEADRLAKEQDEAMGTLRPILSFRDVDSIVSACEVVRHRWDKYENLWRNGEPERVMLERIQTLMGSDEPGCYSEWAPGEDLHDAIEQLINRLTGERDQARTNLTVLIKSIQERVPTGFLDLAAELFHPRVVVDDAVSLLYKSWRNVASLLNDVATDQPLASSVEALANEIKRILNEKDEAVRVAEQERDQAKESLADIDRLLCNVAGNDVITKAEEASRRIRVLSREKDAARAEVERLASNDTALQQRISTLRAQRNAARAEVERLREERDAWRQVSRCIPVKFYKDDGTDTCKPRHAIEALNAWQTDWTQLRHDARGYQEAVTDLQAIGKVCEGILPGSPLVIDMVRELRRTYDETLDQLVRDGKATIFVDDNLIRSEFKKVITSKLWGPIDASQVAADIVDYFESVTQRVPVANILRRLVDMGWDAKGDPLVFVQATLDQGRKERDEARAEVERLRESLAAHRDAHKLVCRERDEVRAEVKRWKAEREDIKCDLTESVAQCERIEHERDEARAAFAACDEQRAANQDAAESAEKRLAEVELERDQAKASLAEWIRNYESLDRHSNDALNEARAEVERLRAALADVNESRDGLVNAKLAMRPVLEAAEAVLARDDADAMVALQVAVEACRGGASAKPCGCTGGPVEHVMDCASIEDRFGLESTIKAHVQPPAETPDGSGQPESVVGPTNVPHRCDTCKHEEKSSDESPCYTCGKLDGGAWCPPDTGYPLWEPQQAQPLTEAPDGAPERAWCCATYDSFHDDHHWGSSGWWVDCEQNGIGREWQIQYVHPDVADREKDAAVRAALEQAAERVRDKLEGAWALNEPYCRVKGVTGCDSPSEAFDNGYSILRAAVLGEEKKS